MRIPVFASALKLGAAIAICVIASPAPSLSGQTTPSPVLQGNTNEYPARLSLMKPADFNRWIVDTEWEFAVGDKVKSLWFVTPSFNIWTEDKGDAKQRGFGYRSTSTGELLWYFDSKDQKRPHKMTIAEDLKSAVLDNAKNKFPMKLVNRRALASLTGVQSLREFEEWSKTRTFKSEVRLWFGTDGLLRRNKQDHTAVTTFPKIGLIESEWSDAWDRSLVIVSPDMKTFRWYAWWGTDDGNIIAGEQSTPKGRVTNPATISVADTAALEIKKRTAAVGGLLVVPLGNSRYAGKSSRLTITSLKLENSQPATIGFNQEVGESMGKALTEVSKYHTLRHDGWPRGQKMEIFFEDKYSPKDGPSAAVACALLVESLITGVELDPGFCVTGDLNADGSVQPIGGVIAKLRGATKGGQKIAAIPQKNRTSALDLAVGEGATPFVGLQLFSVDTFDEALALARNDRTPALAEALSTFAAVSERIRSSPGLLSTPAIRESLAKVATAAPNHVSARLLLAMAEGRLPGQFSASGSLEAVDQAVAAIREATDTDLSATSSLDSGKLSVSRNRLQRLRGMVDNRVQPYVDAWITWASLADQMITRRSAPPQVIEQFKAAISRINAEAKKLEGNSEFMEEVLR